jgi:uncharacterized protein YciI
MEFFCYHRDRPGSLPLRHELLEEHWSYMDGFEKEMIARGPTMTSDGDSPTGSVHVVDLPDPAAAHAFAFGEPGYQAGVYRDVLVRRWRNLLDRTMWDFPGGRTGGNRYLVLGFGSGPGADLAVPQVGDELIAYGPVHCTRTPERWRRPRATTPTAGRTNGPWRRSSAPRGRRSPGRRRMRNRCVSGRT